SENRWALMHEHRGDPEPGLESLLTKLTPVDVVLVEGFKAHAHHKVEAHRNAIGAPLLAATDPAIRAIASDTPLPNLDLPIFHLDDTAAIARFILSAPHCTPAFRRDSAR
ncbi:MAG: molybdopterin-guanine dinucleotide biosynthesis protein MobB, partial [Pseudomonadota bacterium]